MLSEHFAEMVADEMIAVHLQVMVRGSILIRIGYIYRIIMVGDPLYIITKM